MKETLEKLDIDLRRDLDELYSKEQSTRYSVLNKRYLERELSDIGYIRNILESLSMQLDGYYEDVSRELIRRENTSAV